MHRYVVYGAIFVAALVLGAAHAEDGSAKTTSTELAPIDMSGPPPGEKSAPAKPVKPAKPAASAVDRKRVQREEKPEAKPEPARAEKKTSAPKARGAKKGSGKGVAAFWIMLPENS